MYTEYQNEHNPIGAALLFQKNTKNSVNRTIQSATTAPRTYIPGPDWLNEPFNQKRT